MRIRSNPKAGRAFTRHSGFPLGRTPDHAWHLDEKVALIQQHLSDVAMRRGEVALPHGIFRGRPWPGVL
jgi:hypothetical protein